MRFPVFFLVAVLTLGCSDMKAEQSASAKSSAPDAAAPGANDVVAVVDGVEIRRDELDRRAGGRLAAIRQQEYEVRQQILDEIILEKLIAQEAKNRGVSSEALVKTEVEDKIRSASANEIEAVYERARAQLGGRTKEEVRPEIERYLRSQKEAEERARFQQMLRGKSKIESRLEAPRIAVDVPADAPSIGPATAPVTIVEFTDYQCPFCHRAQGTVDELLAKYGDKLRFVHQDFPLESHPRAFYASRASRCANDQGKYWEYHRGLLKEPTDFSDADLVRRAQQVGLDVNGFKTCVESGKHDAAIRAAHKSGIELGVTGTPTFYVNGRVLSGARPRQQFEAIIDQELAQIASK